MDNSLYSVNKSLYVSKKPRLILCMMVTERNTWSLNGTPGHKTKHFICLDKFNHPRVENINLTLLIIHRCAPPPPQL